MRAQGPESAAGTTMSVAGVPLEVDAKGCIELPDASDPSERAMILEHLAAHGFTVTEQGAPEAAADEAEGKGADASGEHEPEDAGEDADEAEGKGRRRKRK